jgi:hypothetical protein
MIDQPGQRKHRHQHGDADAQSDHGR